MEEIPILSESDFFPVEELTIEPSLACSNSLDSVQTAVWEGNIVTVTSFVMDDDGTRLQKVIRECNALSRLRRGHPNLPVMYGIAVDRTNQPLYLVTEYLPRTLRSVLYQGQWDGPWTFKTKVDILLDVARGLAWLHARGISHNNLQPQAIRFDRTGSAKVCGLGDCVVVATAAPRASRLAPGVQARGDIFSFGVVMAELDSGHPPSPSPKQYQGLAMEFSELGRRSFDLQLMSSDALRDLATICLADDPLHRPSAVDLVSLLERLRHHPLYLSAAASSSLLTSTLAACLSPASFGSHLDPATSRNPNTSPSRGGGGGGRGDKSSSGGGVDYDQVATVVPALFLRAVANSDMATVECILSVVNTARDTTGRTALIAAASRGQSEMVALLLKYGADPTALELGPSGCSALLWAARNNHVQSCAELLNAAGPAKETVLSQRDPAKGCSALLLAASLGHSGVVQQLVLCGANPTADTDSAGRTALLYAANQGHAALVEWLINHGSNVHEKDSSGQSALLRVATNGFMACLPLLVNAGADVRQADLHGRTPLHAAALEGHLPVVQWLVQHTTQTGAAATADSNLTPLMFAAYNNHVPLIKWLLANYPDTLNAQASNGQTTLMISAQRGHLDTVQLLVASGADVGLREVEGRTAEQLAAAAGHALIAAYLSTHSTASQQNSSSSPATTTTTPTTTTSSATIPPPPPSVATSAENAADIFSGSVPAPPALHPTPQQRDTPGIGMGVGPSASPTSASAAASTATAERSLCGTNSDTTHLSAAFFQQHQQQLQLLLQMYQLQQQQQQQQQQSFAPTPPNTTTTINNNNNNINTAATATAVIPFAAPSASVSGSRMSQSASRPPLHPQGTAGRRASPSTSALTSREIVPHTRDPVKRHSGTARQQHLQQELLAACYYGRLSAVQQLAASLIATGFPVQSFLQCRDPDGNTPLLLAASQGQLPVMDWLLAHGSTIDERNTEGHTALLLAAFNGQLAALQRMTSHGASPASPTECGVDGWTALLLAASDGHLEVVKWLLAHGSSLQERSRYGHTALMLAASNGHLPTVRWLVEAAGADVNETSSVGYTALSFAAHNGHLPVVHWLMQRDEQSIASNTAAFVARECPKTLAQVATPHVNSYLRAV